MTTDREALLAAVAANPADDTPRLVFADWLDDHGDPDRAEFIRLHCALKREGVECDSFYGSVRFSDDHDPSKTGLDIVAALDRCWELSVRNREWRSEHPAFVEDVEFERGFPCALQITAAEFVAAGERYLRATHFETVEIVDFAVPPDIPRPNLSDLPQDERRPAFDAWLRDKAERAAAADRGPGVRAVAGCEHLRRVRSLDVSDAGFRGSDVETLVNSPYLENLTRLELGDNPDGAGAAAAVAATRRLPRLNDLSFLYLGTAPEQAVGPEGARHLARSARLDQLRELSLYYCNIGDAGAKALANAKILLRNVVRLGLVGNGIGVEGLAAFAQSRRMTRLSELFASGNDFGGAGVSSLASAPFASQLTGLCLSCNRLTPHGVRAITESPTLGGLRWLSLGGHGEKYPVSVGAEGGRLLGAAPNLNRLQSLSLDESQLGDDGIVGLAAGTGLTAVRSLDVHKNAIGPVGISALAGAAKFAGLRDLVIYGNPIGPAGAAALAGSPHLGNLHTLKMHRCNIGDDGLFALLRAPWIGNLINFFLAGNDLTDRSVTAFVSAPSFRRVRLFDLEEGVGDLTAAAVARSPYAACLGWLSLGPNLTDDGCRELAESPYLNRIGRLSVLYNPAITEAGLRPLWQRYGTRVVHRLDCPPEFADRGTSF